MSILKPINKLGTFRFWCQKVLPLVYDDSLSYYELLCKVVNYLNNVIENVDTLNENINQINTDVTQEITNLQNAFNTLQNYVDNYFNNLDVTNEINNKLDEMAEDGTLSEIIAPFIGNATNFNFAPAGKLYGGQLNSLYLDILNPLKQHIQINLIGDSITWGSGASDVNTAGGRAGVPADPRNFYNSPCWANLFKRYIKSFLVAPVTETLSNYPTSPSGESVVTYVSNEQLSFYPQNWTASPPSSGGSITLGTSAVVTNYGLGARFNFNGNFSGNNDLSIEGFTGDRFIITHRTVSGELQSPYAVYINNNLAATFTYSGTAEATEDTQDSVVLPAKVWNAKISIRPINYDTSTNNYNIRLIKIDIPKTIVIDNCGIIGTTIGNANVNIANNNLVLNKGNYNFLALGINNRLIGNALTNGSRTDGLIYSYNTLLTTLDGYTDGNNNIIVGTTPPAIDAPTSPYQWNSQIVNNALMTIAKDNELDFINMFEVFTGLENADYTSDGLHPNDYGHNIMYNNIRHMMSL